MARVAASTQVELILKVLLSILAYPSIKAQELAKALGVHPNTIARLLMQFRTAGLNIEYDFEKQRYDIDLSERLQKSVLGKLAARLHKVLSQSAQRQPQVRFVSSLENYTIPQFASMIATTPQNVYNMVIGYKGARLPAGYVAYQMQDRSKWHIMKMTTDRSGKKFTVPGMLKDAFRVVKGEGEKVGAAQRAPARCQAITKERGQKVHCPDDAVLKGYCTKHYYQQRRHPERFLSR